MTNQTIEMTEAQKREIEWLRTEILKHDGHRNERAEYKRFEVRVDDVCGKPFVTVMTTVGNKNDEGTMAEVYARTSRVIKVGVRGGLRLLNPGKFNKKTGRVDYSNARIHGRRVVYWTTK
jgi:hypothetical protein